LNILFISSLYPQKKDDFVTKALHNIVKHWNNKGKIIVIRPVYIYLSELLIGKYKGSFIPKKIFIEDVTVIVFPIFKIPKITYFYYPLLKYINKYIKNKSFEFDIVVAHYDKSLKIGYQYSKQNQIPFVTGFHITPDLLEENYMNFDNRCSRELEYSSLIACRSQYIYNKITRWYPMYKSKSFFAYSGIENELIINVEDTVKRLKQWKLNKKVLFISVCTLIKRKNIHTNLIALSQLGNIVNWNYTIIGEGEERSDLEQLVIQLGIVDKVFFKGKLSRDEVISELKRSHIFIMVSHSETFGLAYLEAMATGNIVVGSIFEGIDGIIKNGDNGFLVPAGDFESLVNVLEKILFYMEMKELKNILLSSLRTIKFYTEKQASENYWNQLKKITSK